MHICRAVAAKAFIFKFILRNKFSEILSSTSTIDTTIPGCKNVGIILEETMGWGGSVRNRAKVKSCRWVPPSQRAQRAKKDLNFKENIIKVA